MSDLLAVVGGPAPAAVLLAADNRLEPVPLDELSVAAGAGSGGEAAVAAVALARVRTSGVAPGRMAVVVDDDLDGSGREAVVAAVREAGVADVVSVPRSIAEARRPPAGADRSDGLLVVAGAALVARELPADPVPAEPPVAAPSAEPVVEAGPPPGALAAGEPALDHEIPRHRLSPVALVVVVVLLLGAAAVAYLVLAGDDEGEPAAEPGATTTTDAPVPSATDEPVDANPEVDASTSTTAAPPDESAAPPITEPTPVGEPGAVTLSAAGLVLDGGTVLRFGQGADTVIDEVRRVLGDPDDDAEWAEAELFLVDRLRTVRWGDLEVVLEEVGCTGRFGQWYADGADDPEGLVDASGLGVGATVGFLEVTYGDALQIDVFTEGEPEGIFGITDTEADTGGSGVLIGSTTGLDPDATVTALWAGDTCPRAF